MSTNTILQAVSWAVQNRVDVPRFVFSDNGFSKRGQEEPDATELYGTINIMGALHHIRAIQVETRDGEQVAVNPTLQKALNLMYQFNGADEPFQIVVIDGKGYVLGITPHGSDQ